MVDILIQQPIIITEDEAKLIALLRKYGIFTMGYGQVILHFADGELKKVDKNEAVYKKS